MKKKKKKNFSAIKFWPTFTACSMGSSSLAIQYIRNMGLVTYTYIQSAPLNACYKLTKPKKKKKLGLVL